MENNNTTINYKSPNPVWFVFRIFILCVLIFILLYAIVDMSKRSGVLKIINEWSDDTTYYDKYYYEGSYGSLRDLMYLHDYPEDEYYGKYWEIVTANDHLKAYNDYSAGATAGVEGAVAFADKEKQELEQMLKNVKFPDNKERIQALLDSIE